MRNSRFLVIGVMLVLAALLIAPVAAQEEGAGEGGILFYSDTSDPQTFNPLLGGDVTSSNVYNRIYPALLGVNPFTGAYEPGWKDSMATGWEFDETGTVLTVTLREDAFWTDGEQVTAEDWMWGVNAMRSGLLDSSRPTQIWAVLDDGTEGSGPMVDARMIDDFTLEIEFGEPDCDAINNVWGTMVPAHIYEEDFGDDLVAMNDEPRYLPGVYFGGFVDPELIAGDRVSLVANQDYVDAELGYVSPSELVILNLPNVDVEIERFRAGELTLTGIPGTQQAEFEADENFQTFRYNRLGYVFYAFNHANPDNPQPGLDEEGNRLVQDPHPVLGDQMVRQALVMAVDMDAIIENNLGGNAVRVGIPSIPASWDWNPDLQYPFDPAAAAEMLDEAGWVLGDGEFRVCSGCAYTEIDPEFEGTEMSVTLNSSAGGSEDSVNMIEFIAESFRDIGVNAETNFIDWSTAFLPELDGQTFDMAILAWSLGLPLSPDNTAIFTIPEDIPGSGFNFGSFHSEELDQLYKDARNPAMTNGCDLEARAELYAQANQILFDELPYMFMYSNLSMTAAQSWLENFDPAEFSRTWNEDAFIALDPSLE